MPNKKQVFKSFWVSMENRLPPETDDPVLLWNPEINGCVLSTCIIVQAQQTQIIEKTISKKSLDQPLIKQTGYYATHWMRIYSP